MVRQLRIEFPGGLYHIMSRGNEKKDIYLSGDDFRNFIAILRVAAERFHWLCHSYCLMNNHYHLLIETPLGNLSKGMHYINGVYTQRFNKTHNRVGHVFQGRYKAIVVEKDSYLLELSRYIVLNPVRAKLVSHSSEWPWSSYLATCGVLKAPEWLEVDSILSLFSSEKSRAIQRYRHFIDEGAAQNPERHLKNNLYLGSDAFVMNLMKRIDPAQDFTNISKAQYTQPELIPSLKAFEQSSGNRNDAIKLAFDSGAYTLSEIGRYFGLHFSTISKIVNKKTGEVA